MHQMNKKKEYRLKAGTEHMLIWHKAPTALANSVQLGKKKKKKNFTSFGQPTIIVLSSCAVTNIETIRIWNRHEL